MRGASSPSEWLYTEHCAAHRLAAGRASDDVGLAALRDGSVVKFTADELQRYIDRLPAH